MRLGCSINLLLTQLPPRSAAEMEEEVDQENRKLFGKRVYLQSPRLILPVGSVCLLSPGPGGPGPLGRQESRLPTVTFRPRQLCQGSQGKPSPPPPHDTRPKAEPDTNQPEI